MASTRAAAVLDGLVATLQAYSGLCAPGGTGVWVYDGPETAVSAELPQEYVAIGWNGDVGGDGVAVDIQQDWHDFGTPADAERDEFGEVTCIVDCAPLTTADTDIAALRTRAVVVLGLVEAAIRATSGLGVAELIECGMVAGQLQQQQTEAGALVRIPFTIRYHAII